MLCVSLIYMETFKVIVKTRKDYKEKVKICLLVWLHSHNSRDFFVVVVCFGFFFLLSSLKLTALQSSEKSLESVGKCSEPNNLYLFRNVHNKSVNSAVALCYKKKNNLFPGLCTDRL